MKVEIPDDAWIELVSPSAEGDYRRGRVLWFAVTGDDPVHVLVASSKPDDTDVAADEGLPIAEGTERAPALDTGERLWLRAAASSGGSEVTTTEVPE